MNKLLKEAIADAKAVRETALANAKLALEEAFTPRLQSMLSAKLSEEEEMDMDEDEDMTMDASVAEPEMEAPTEEGMREDDEDPTDMYSEEEDMDMEEEMEEPAVEPEMEMEGEDDLELEAIIRELEGEIEGSDDLEEGEEEVAAPAAVEPEAEEVTEGDEAEDDVSIDEIIKALKEEDGEDEITENDDTEEAEVTEAAEEDLEEAYTVIKFLRSKINEVNLLNAKLLFSNKLFRNFAMNESQKMKVIENFDRASTIREVKLVFSTLAESLKVNKTKRIVKESTASAPIRSTAPKKILSEGNALASRWAKLAGLNKNN